jgi:hypothetical protein
MVDLQFSSDLYLEECSLFREVELDQETLQKYHLYYGETLTRSVWRGNTKLSEWKNPKYEAALREVRAKMRGECARAQQDPERQKQIERAGRRIESEREALSIEKQTLLLEAEKLRKHLPGRITKFCAIVVFVLLTFLGLLCTVLAW